MEQNEVLKALRRDHAAELKLAAERLKGTARHTEIIPSPVLSEMTGHEILLKPENLQVTGSFKIRGAYNKIASLSDEQLAHGIVTASAGNHAQGVAYAARERGAKATICMPQITPPLKVDATKAYGADVVLCGEVFDESAAHAQELSDNEGMIYVPPFDDYEVLCGQGTIGLEILEDVPNVTDVVVPLGRGGLGAGVALAIKTFKPEVRVIGAIPEGSPAWKNSLAAGRVVAADQVRMSGTHTPAASAMSAPSEAADVSPASSAAPARQPARPHGSPKRTEYAQCRAAGTVPVPRPALRRAFPAAPHSPAVQLSRRKRLSMSVPCGD